MNLLRALLQRILAWLGLGRGTDGGFTLGGSADAGGAPSEEGGHVVEPITKPDVTAATSDLSDGFFAKLAQMGLDEGWDPRLLLPVMAHESGLKANAYNAGGPAYGLIQFFGPNWSFIRTLDAEGQEPYIANYYRAAAPYRTVGEVYGQTYLPARMAARGRSPGTVLSTKGEAFYDQNPSLDYNKDDEVTLQDLEDVANAAAKGLGKRYTESLARLNYAMSQVGTGGSGGVPFGVVAVGGILALGAAYALLRR